MRILLVRHGQSLGNVDPKYYHEYADHDLPLSNLGSTQAGKAGIKIANFLRDNSPLMLNGFLRHHVRLWNSPYRRTRETANIIEAVCKEKGFPFTDRKEHVLLCEQQFGLFDGLSDEELQDRYPVEHAHYQKCEEAKGRFWARMPLGESRFDVAMRIHQVFGTFHRDYDKHGVRTIVVVCHGVTLRAFVMMWCHYEYEWIDKEPNPTNCAIRVIEDGKDKGYLP